MNSISNEVNKKAYQIIKKHNSFIDQTYIYNHLPVVHYSLMDMAKDTIIDKIINIPVMKSETLLHLYNNIFEYFIHLILKENMEFDNYYHDNKNRVIDQRVMMYLIYANKVPSTINNKILDIVDNSVVYICGKI